MFWHKPLVSGDMAAWIEECFDWFDARFPVPEGPILPTKAFFSAGSGRDEATAQAVLNDIKRLLGYDLPIALAPIQRMSAAYRHDYQKMGEAAGLYYETDEGRLIQYDPEMMARPVAFINTMAHEVMHARLSGLQDQVPGGEGAHELATDLGCIIAGFGVFQLQDADDQGWSGYMTQSSRAHALALFLKRRDMELETVLPHLSGRCGRLLRKAAKQLS